MKLKFIIIAFIISIPSFSQPLKEYVFDRYSIDGGKSWEDTRAYFKLYKLDSAWLIYRDPNTIIKYVIYDNYKTKFPADTWQMLLTTNLNISTYKKCQVKEDIMLGPTYMIISFRDGNFLQFHIMQKYK